MKVRQFLSQIRRGRILSFRGLLQFLEVALLLVEVPETDAFLVAAADAIKPVFVNSDGHDIKALVCLSLAAFSLSL